MSETTLSTRKFEQDGFTVIIKHVADDRQCETPEEQQANYAGESAKDKAKYFKQDKARAPQLFPTPTDLARRMVHLAKVSPSSRVLEPSAGTGRLIDAVTTEFWNEMHIGPKYLTAVELSTVLCSRLYMKRMQLTGATDENFPIVQGDFLAQNGNLGKFDVILMNPPFADGADIKHIEHAMKFLNPGGRLVAICADGPRQNDRLRPMVEAFGGLWEPLPEGTFSEQGTNVRTVLISLTNEQIADSDNA